MYSKLLWKLFCFCLTASCSSPNDCNAVCVYRCHSSTAITYILQYILIGFNFLKLEDTWEGRHQSSSHYRLQFHSMINHFPEMFFLRIFSDNVMATKLIKPLKCRKGSFLLNFRRIATLWRRSFFLCTETLQVKIEAQCLPLSLEYLDF